MPLYRRLPKLGFTSAKKVRGDNQYSIINIGALNVFEDGATVDAAALTRAGLVRKLACDAGIKVLGSGSCDKRLVVKVQAVSAKARALIEAKGGSVELV